jgi:hypothetical protein
LTDALSGLAELTWRPDSFDDVLRAPCAAAGFEFEHTLPERGYPYVDGEGHDWTGRGSITTSPRLIFLNSVEPNSFPGNFDRWQPALFTGQAGDLVHPILGVVRARVRRVSVPLEATVRNGTILDVTWVETVDDPSERTAYLLVDANLTTSSSAAETAANAVGVFFVTGITAAAYKPTSTPTRPTFPSAESHTSLSGAVAELQSLFRSSQATEAMSLASQIAGRTAAMIREVERLGSPEAWPAYDNLVLAWAQLKDIAERVNKKIRPTARVQLQTDTTLDAFARERSNSVGDVIALNPHALAKPLVEKGFFLRYYTGKS